MIDRSPNCFSIWARARSNARWRSLICPASLGGSANSATIPNKCSLVNARKDRFSGRYTRFWAPVKDLLQPLGQRNLLPDRVDWAVRGQPALHDRDVTDLLPAEVCVPMLLEGTHQVPPAAVIPGPANPQLRPEPPP